MKNMKTRLDIFFIAISVCCFVRECYSKKYTIERTVSTPVFNPFKRQPHKMVKHSQTIRRQIADELFECL